MKSIYDKTVTDDLIQRVGRLTPESTPVWGTMTVDQMLAHCSVPYEMAFAPDADQRFKKATGLKKWFLTKFLKPVVVGEKPYRKGLPTAPEFKMVDQRDFDVERDKLLGFVRQSHEQGRQFFEGRESPSFGKMTADEWSNLYYKHLDHHLQQFGV